jgi:TRAP-type C4-dicarboxylate transport system permease small subunit
MAAVMIDADGDSRATARIGAAVVGLSRLVALWEKVAVTALSAAIFGLILLNVATRAAGRPLIWVDEAAVYLMVAMCFIGASLTVRQRLDFAVTFVIDRAGPRGRRAIDAALSATGLAYAVFLLWCAWEMFDPAGLWAAGFDIARFTATTLNFVYTEPTQTIGIPRYIVYLVLPVYAAGLSVHAAANLVEDCGWVPRPAVDAGLGLEQG